MTASPMNFSTVPPYRVIRVRQVSKYRVNRSRTSSASRCSDNDVKPTRSANSTETSRSSVEGVWSARAAEAAWPGGTGDPPRAAPHSPQNRTPCSLAEPQVGQTRASGRPQPPQNLRPGAFAVPQLEQITGTSIGAARPTSLGVRAASEGTRADDLAED